MMADGGTESSIDAFSIVGFSRQLCSWCFVLFIFENSSLYTLVTINGLNAFSNRNQEQLLSVRIVGSHRESTFMFRNKHVS